MIDSNILMRETLEAISIATSVTYKHQILFVLPDGNEVSPLSLLNINITRDCENTWYDGVKVKISAGLGFFNQLSKYHSNILVRLISTPVISTGKDVKSLPSTTRLMRAVLSESSTKFMLGAYTGRDDGDLDLTNSAEVDVQLFDLAVEGIKHASVGGTVHNLTLLDALRYYLGTTKKTLSLPSEAEVKGVDLAKVDGGKVWNDIVIPHGTPVIKVAQCLRKNYYGLYPTGTAWYFYKNHFYVYPRYNTDGSIHTSKNLTLLNIPSDRFKGIENTYVEDKTSIKIICTGESSFSDNSVSSNYNVGVGIRYFDPERLDGNFGRYEDGRYTVDRNSNLSEFAIKESDTGKMNASFHPDLITSDIETAIGDIYRASLRQVTLVWENSNEALIRPGMAGIYIQEDRSGVFGYHCTVLKSAHDISMIGSKIQDERYASQSVITIALGKIIK